MLDKDDWNSLRWLYLREGKSQRWIANEFGISRNTVAKYVEDPNPPKYNTKGPRRQPVKDQWRQTVKAMLEEDKNSHRKQKHTASRVFSRLVDEHGYTGSRRTVISLVAAIRNKAPRPVTIPLLFEPGKDAQVDFGESFVELDGKLTKVHGFEMRFNYSRSTFLMFFPSTNREAFLEGHVRAFEYFVGVPERISYDNLKAAVNKVLEGKARQLNDSFKNLTGYYAFQHNFCTPGKGNEKGGVENSIGYTRRNWLVPVPKFKSFDELNAYALEKCKQDMQRKVEGQELTIGQAWEIEKVHLLALPERPFEPYIAHRALVDGYSTVRLERNRYSVPSNFGGKTVWLKAFWNKVEISDGQKVIACHPRKYGRDQFELDPQHYLDLLEEKPNAVPYARPIREHQWPAGYWQFYQRLTKLMGTSHAGKEFIRVLRMHIKYGCEYTAAAIAEANNLSIANADIVLCIIRRNSRSEEISKELDMSTRNELAQYEVSFTELSQYHLLLSGEQPNAEQCVA